MDAPANPAVCCARLTLTSGVPVTTADVTGASTVYLTPYRGNLVALYTGSAWGYHTLTEISIALSGLTAGKVYDVFLHDNAGTLTLTLSAAWTNDTTRADALATQDGVRVLDSDHTKRLVGTLCATAATTTEDSGFTTVPAKRYVMNENNRVPKRSYAEVAWGSVSYNSATWRPANNDANIVVYGLCPPDLILSGQFGGTQSSGAIYQLGLGDGSTNTPMTMQTWAASYQSGQLSSNVAAYVAEGRHTFYALERAPGGSATAATAWMELVFWV